MPYSHVLRLFIVRCSVCGCTVVYVYMWAMFPWVLGFGVMLAGFLAWFQNIGNIFNIVSLYQVFPILGGHGV